MALKGGGVELRAESLVEVQILASQSCSAGEGLLEKQRRDSFLQGLHFLPRRRAVLALSQSHEPHGLPEPPQAGCAASLNALLGQLRGQSQQQVTQQLRCATEAAALVEQDLSVGLVTQREVPLVC